MRVTSKRQRIEVESLEVEAKRPRTEVQSQRIEVEPLKTKVQGLKIKYKLVAIAFCLEQCIVVFINP